MVETCGRIRAESPLVAGKFFAETSKLKLAGNAEKYHQVSGNFLPYHRKFPYQKSDIRVMK